MASAADVDPTLVMADPTSCKVCARAPVADLGHRGLEITDRRLHRVYLRLVSVLRRAGYRVEIRLDGIQRGLDPALPPVSSAGLASAFTECPSSVRASHTACLPDATVVVVLDAFDFELDEHPVTARAASALTAARDLSFSLWIRPPFGWSSSVGRQPIAMTTCGGTCDELTRKGRTRSSVICHTTLPDVEDNWTFET